MSGIIRSRRDMKCRRTKCRGTKVEPMTSLEDGQDGRTLGRGYPDISPGYPRIFFHNK